MRTHTVSGEIQLGHQPNRVTLELSRCWSETVDWFRHCSVGQIVKLAVCSLTVLTVAFFFGGIAWYYFGQ